MILSEDDHEGNTTQATPKQNKNRIWKREDISYPSRTPYSHPKPAEILNPYDYFQTLFTPELIHDIVYQTNLYARQKNVNTTFKTNYETMQEFVGILIYMGVVHLPSIDDYWDTATRIPQVCIWECSHAHFRDYSVVSNISCV